MKYKRAIFAAALALASAQPAFAAGAACRVTDFSDKPLSALNEVQRLSFVLKMTRTEYDRLKAKPVGDANHYALLANSPTLPEARAAAQAKLDSLKLDNVDEYAKVWWHDYLDDTQVRKLADCESARQPGLALYGRSENPGQFHLTYVHITPIGIEKITTKVVASSNIANIAELEKELLALGPQDNYIARTFPLKLINPGQPAVVVMRGGWETPKFIYIPAYPNMIEVKP
jgi:hypothetical protein